MGMYIETLEIAGFQSAIYGMRNPMNSWSKMDTKMDLKYDIGEKDLILAKKLIRAGNEHCKFLRQIQVWANVNMPRYWWSEADTYKFGTKNSCSTMHKLLNDNKWLTRDDFVEPNYISTQRVLDQVISTLNTLKVEYQLAKVEGQHDKANKLLIDAKRILPEGYLQLRTWNTNYAELMNMYHQRKNHRLKEEWINIFCDWCENLPYFKEMCINGRS